MIHKYHLPLFYVGLLVTLCIADTLSTAAPYYCNGTDNIAPLAPDPSDKAHIDKLPDAGFAQKPQKLHLPFVANQRQMNEKVRSYANTFGETVFATKNGEIVYALEE